MSDFPSLLRLPCLAVVFVALLSACPGQAQSFDASGPTGIDRPTPLGGTWLMKPGDDLAYAQPGYDDSAWTRMDLSHDLHDYVRGPRPGGGLVPAAPAHVADADRLGSRNPRVRARVGNLRERVAHSPAGSRCTIHPIPCLDAVRGTASGAGCQIGNCGSCGAACDS